MRLTSHVAVKPIVTYSVNGEYYKITEDAVPDVLKLFCEVTEVPSQCLYVGVGDDGVLNVLVNPESEGLLTPAETQCVKNLQTFIRARQFNENSTEDQSVTFVAINRYNGRVFCWSHHVV